MKISVIPFSVSLLNNLFFDPNYGRDNVLEPFSVIKEKFELNNDEIETVDILKIKDADYIIFFSLELRYLLQAMFLNKLKKSIYIQFEPPVVRDLHKPKNLLVIAKVFSQVLTWQDDLVGTKNFKKFHFPMPSLQGSVEKKLFINKKLITTIVGFKKSNRVNELYSHRIKAIRFFEKNMPESFEFYGVGWDRVQFPSYRGPVDNKLEKLSEYKFSICYENECSINGLISEKIFDCFYAGVIPVFWGAENINDYIPSECFVDKRNFPDYTNLLDYLERMPESDYLERLISVRNYLSSEGFKKHSSSYFAQTIVDAINDLEVRKKVGLLSFLRFLNVYIVVKITSFMSKIKGKKWSRKERF